MAKYVATGYQTGMSNNVDDAPLQITVNASTAHRIKVFEVLFGCAGSPADNSIRWVVQRCSAVGTSGGSALTPPPLDPADAAARSVVLEEMEGVTETANTEFLDFQLNQRASFRWVAAPGAEIAVPATVNHGLFVAALHSSVTVGVRGQMLFEEG